MNRCALLLLVLTMSLAACIPPQVRRSELIDYPAQPGTTIAQPPANKVNVIFLRPDISGNLYSAAVYDGDKFVSLHTVDTHRQYLATPGKHQFMVSVFSGYPAFLDVELEGGKIYFIKIHGVLKGLVGVWPESGTQLLPVEPGSDDWKQLKTWLAKSYEVHASARSQEWAEQHHPSVMKKKQKAMTKWNEWEERPRHKKEYGVSKFE